MKSFFEEIPVRSFCNGNYAFPFCVARNGGL